MHRKEWVSSTPQNHVLGDVLDTAFSNYDVIVSYFSVLLQLLLKGKNNIDKNVYISEMQELD